MSKIVFASDNAHKLAEIQAMTPTLTLIPQIKFNVSPIPETGLTFVENALIKARHASQATGLPALADDSGLCVNALEGAPGLYSARFGGDINYVQKMVLLNETLAPFPDKSAYFYCALVLLQHAEDPTPLIAEGRWHGKIITTPRGAHGFGYDPCFWVPEQHCSAAELSPEVKQQISHRGLALAQLQAALTSNT